MSRSRRRAQPKEREEPAPAPPDDVVLPCGPTEDGHGVHVLRKRGERLEIGELRAAEEGKPLHGDLVRLSHREGTPLYDVETLHELERSPRGGPAQVATDKYRKGWESVFRRAPRALPN